MIMSATRLAFDLKNDDSNIIFSLSTSLPSAPLSLGPEVLLYGHMIGELELG